MLAGRFGLGILALALAGSFAGQGLRAESSGSMKTETWEFGALTVAVLILVGGLSFLPAIAAGPIFEHFAGRG